jgi:hypothetical protein
VGMIFVNQGGKPEITVGKKRRTAKRVIAP